MTGWLTLAGALIVALITAYTTDRRLSRQIEAERERQKLDLEAEADRQAATLKHDRELADIADLRGLLDEAALTLHAARDASDTLAIQLVEHGLLLIDEDKNAFANAGRAMLRPYLRLVVRLGEAHPIAVTFEEAQEAMERTWRMIAWVDDDTPEVRKEKRASIDADRTALAAVARSFFEEAVKLAGVRTSEAN